MKFHPFYFLLIALIALSCSSPLQKTLIQKEEVRTAILIQNVDIFNGRDSVLQRQQDVLIEEGIIKTISANIATQPEYHVINGEGKTLMPGLIDSHVHISGSGAVPWANVSANEEYNLSAYLYAGITTIYDLGGLAGNLDKLAQKVEKKEVLGPTIFHTHIPITVKNSHPIPLTKIMLPWPLSGMVNSISPTIEEVDDAPNVIKKYLKNSVDYVKIACDQIPPGSAEMTSKQLNALVVEAHKQGKKVFVHIGSPENAVNAVNAGADVIAHGIWRGELTPDQADRIAESGIPIIYTIAGFQNVADIYEGHFHPRATTQYLVSEEVLSPVTGDKGKDVQQQEVMNDFFKDVSEKRPYWKHNFELLKERKVPIAIGTDSNLPGTYAGATYYQELDELLELGLTNFQILSGATYLNAHLFLENPNFGTIEEGKRADLLLLDANPLENLKAVKTPQQIICRGEIISRK